MNANAFPGELLEIEVDVRRGDGKRGEKWRAERPHYRSKRRLAKVPVRGRTPQSTMAGIEREAADDWSLSRRRPRINTKFAGEGQWECSHPATS